MSEKEYMDARDDFEKRVSWLEHQMKNLTKNIPNQLIPMKERIKKLEDREMPVSRTCDTCKHHKKELPQKPCNHCKKAYMDHYEPREPVKNSYLHRKLPVIIKEADSRILPCRTCIYFDHYCTHVKAAKKVRIYFKPCKYHKPKEDASRTCFMGDCNQNNDDPCEDYEAQTGKWGKCHEYEPREVSRTVTDIGASCKFYEKGICQNDGWHTYLDDCRCCAYEPREEAKR